MKRLLGLICLAIAGCSQAAPADQRSLAGFPLPDRPVSAIVSSRWSTEPDRDRLGEAETVMARSGITPGMSVADIGAGEGYYTIRLAKQVGPNGRVLAEDIMPDYLRGLAQRIERERLGNVSATRGTPDDPKLPVASVDRALLIHMYHEIADPYAFLWRLRPALKPGGRVIVIDADRPTDAHGTPPKLLACEFAALGYVLVDQVDMPAAGGYLAAFEARGPRPEPRAIRGCEA